MQKKTQAWKRRPAKMQKKCKKMQAWKQRPAKTQNNAKTCKQNAKVCGHCQNHQQNEKLAFFFWGHFFACFFAFCFLFFFFVFFFLLFFDFFLRFGRPLFLGLHLFCILAGRGFQACVFFAFWSSLGFRCAFVSHFAGSRPFQPKRMQKQCKAQFKQASKHKKKQSKILAGQQTRKTRKQQMQNKCNTQKCKQQMQKKHKIYGAYWG